MHSTGCVVLMKAEVACGLSAGRSGLLVALARRRWLGGRRQDAAAHDEHGAAARGALHRWTRCGGGWWRRMLEHQQVQQGDEAFAVGVQEAEIAGAPESFGQDMLEHEVQEGGAVDGAQGHLLGLAVAPAVGDEAALATRGCVSWVHHGDGKDWRGISFVLSIGRALVQAAARLPLAPVDVGDGREQ
jgi:hypothetical protein